MSVCSGLSTELGCFSSQCLHHGERGSLSSVGGAWLGSLILLSFLKPGFSILERGASSTFSAEPLPGSKLKYYFPFFFTFPTLPTSILSQADFFSFKLLQAASVLQAPVHKKL